MPTPTYDLISEQVLSSAQASVTFNSIPGTYKDLVLEIVATISTISQSAAIQFNGDTASNYSWTRMMGTGSSAGSYRMSNVTSNHAGYVFTAQSANYLQIMSYANTNVFKTSICRANDPSNYIATFANLWRSTSAITSIYVWPDTGANWASGSTFRLWGIL